MNPEVKAKWLEALRSGEYKQGKHFLKAAGKHCCLGVLCELAEAAGHASSNKVNEITRFSEPGADSESLSSAYLPVSVQVWAGLSDSYAAFRAANDIGIETPSGLSVQSLSGANDGGLTFEQIAKLIEEYF